MDENNLENLYKQVIMEHYKCPLNKGLEKTKKTYPAINATCGDKFGIQITMNNNIIESIKQDGAGCSISVASCSIMTQVLAGKTKTQALQLIEKFESFVAGKSELTEEENDIFQDAIVFEGIKHYPARYKCATLAWSTVKDILQKL